MASVVHSPNRDRFGAMNYLIDKLGYNEVETCSGTGMGFCRFSFTNANGQKLAVVTVNNQPGQKPKLHAGGSRHRESLVPDASVITVLLQQSFAPHKLVPSSGQPQSHNQNVL
ncbi:hypothetical protein JOY44_31020 (plasmid) [Phormidium sp. CLA17]|uniref:hypothetical protein n=1 Tax=Leptolyngbya sp. Cla-17 TaxID=2803751 RepID=UPI00193244F3|nr:hypothetical protein [Leptolyngbya sp. Cla-17]MBM0745801.1 hypothetical protein [Leptolyngbya sp. Cla-17]